MSDAVIVAVILAASVNLLGLILCQTWIRVASIQVKAYQGQMPQPLRDYSKEEFFEEDELREKVERAFDEGEKGETAPPAPALPIDPSNPPRTIIFPDAPGPRPKCVCHGRIVQPGDRILIWPDGEGFRVFCPKEDA